jgi:hypothetical protein
MSEREAGRVSRPVASGAQAESGAARRRRRQERMT